MSALSVRTPSERERQAYFFERLRERLQSLARTVSGEFKVQVRWAAGKPATDGRSIQLNPTIEYEEAPLLSAKWWVVQKATSAHEAFHVATTDMAAYRRGIEALVREGRLPPKMAQLVANSAEDARIEYHGKRQWSGIRLWLEYANDLAFRAHEGRIAKASVPEAAATALMLAIIVGRLPKGAPAEAMDAIKKLSPLIEQIREAEGTAEAMNLALDLARDLPPIFRKAPPDLPVRLLGTPVAVPLPSGPVDDEPNGEPGGGDDGAEAEDAGELGGFDAPDDDTLPDSREDVGSAGEEPEEEPEDVSDEREADTPPDAGDDTWDAGEEEPDEPTPFEDEPEPEGDGDRADDGEGADPTEEEAEDEPGGGAEADDDTSPEAEDDASEAGDTECPEYDDGTEEADGGEDDAAPADDAGEDETDSPSDPGDSLPDMAADFERLLEAAGSELEEADADALLEARSRPLSPEEIAGESEERGAGFEEMTVDATGAMRSAYALALYETAALRERFYRTLLQTLRPPRPEPHTGSKRGRLDVHRAWRAPALGDLAVFARKTVQPSLKGVAVYVLVDSSGSMNSPAATRAMRRGILEPKYYVARRAAVVVCDALRRVGVAHTAVGFTEDDRPRVIHLRLVDWDDQTPEGQMGLGGITALANNRDGYSIRIATAELLQRREETKILLVLSDGMPAADRYSGPAAVEDTARAVREAGRKGVLLAGLFFGSNDPASVAAASYMYPDLACLFGDISHLPEVVGNTVVRLLRRAAYYG